MADQPTVITGDTVRFAAQVIEALKGNDAFDAGYGTFYISRIEFAFDGDPVGCHLEPEDTTWNLVTD